MQLMMALREDHNNIRSLLIILQNKLAVIDSGSRPNFSLLAEAVEYFAEYADDYHHPREELIYSYLKEHYPASKRILRPREEDHQVLRKLTQELSAAVSKLQYDVPLAIRPFAQLLSKFIEKQKEHLEWEEHKVFPMFEQVLNLDDWKKLETQAFALSAPLAAGGRSEHCHALCEALIEDLA